MRAKHVPALLILGALLAAPASANLIEKAFPGKDEPTIVKEFADSLQPFLEKQLKEPVNRPRVHVPLGKRGEVYAEITGVGKADSTWTTLVRYAWYDADVKYAFKPYGKAYKLAYDDLPPKSVVSWYNLSRITLQQVVSLACWLKDKKELQLANAVMAGFAAEKKDFKGDTEAWVGEMYGWTVPPGGLEVFATVDMNTGTEGFRYFTAEAKQAFMKDFEKEAKTEFSDLRKRQGGDIKGKPGYRKKSPTMRLDMLQKRIERYAKAYAETAFIKKKTTQKDLTALTAAVTGDQAFIEEEKFVAERKGIDGDWLAAAKAYDRLLWLDPKNPNMVMTTAEAYSKAAVIVDAGRKAGDKAAAGKAAQLYERMTEIFPARLDYHNHAGINWFASGDKKRAKKHHEFVIERTDDRSDLTEGEKTNRAYAETQLKYMK